LNEISRKFKPEFQLKESHKKGRETFRGGTLEDGRENPGGILR